jgi:hypothetical protein
MPVQEYHGAETTASKLASQAALQLSVQVQLIGARRRPGVGRTAGIRL